MYDRLQVAKVLPGHWVLPVPARADATAWPYVALYARSGSTSVDLADRRIDLAQGDLCVARNHGRLEIRASADMELLVIRVPQEAIGPYRQALDDAEGRHWSTESGTASLVAHLLDGLAAQLDDYHPANPGRFAYYLVGLIALMCADGGPTALGSVRARTMERAKEYIERNLGDVDLTPDRVATAQNVSTRTLHRLFESEGLTISGWIRLRRLEHCRMDLTDRASEDLSISSIGAKWGLYDAAHFSRLFKSSYGISPRAYRLAQGQGEPARHRTEFRYAQAEIA
ncbi:helix-turn-helix domain-containing protein [Micromonospora pallida]|uniref:helix-turn-helix domain-containing protein n=1 Tax=Micromonospora pallida TaxID=145854 RepID=UPI00159F0AC9|nr:helix-turn-helix domain-containing protein [Micromonospora pallida]